MTLLLDGFQVQASFVVPATCVRLTLKGRAEVLVLR
jgi:hypothetical protein